MSDPARIDPRPPGNLRYIRDGIQISARFTLVPGWGAFVIGWTSIGAAFAAQKYASGDDPRWVAIWLAEAVVAACIAAIAIEVKRRRARLSVLSSGARRFWIGYFAPIAAAALLTSYLFDARLLAALPPTWLLLYGASFVSSGAFAARIVPAMGGLFMLLGVVACFVPLSAGNVLLGAGFGGLHVLFGWIIARHYGG